MPDVDPLQLMMALRGVQGFSDNLGAARRGVPAQAGGGGGGADEIVPMMQLMQRSQLMQAQQKALDTENALNQKKFEAAQQAAAREQTGVSQWAQQMGISPEQATSAWDEMKKAIASRYQTRQLGDKEEVRGPNGELIAKNAAALDMNNNGVVFDPESGQAVVNPDAFKAAREVARGGATNVQVSPTAIYGATQGAADQEIYKAAGQAYVATQKEAENARKMASDFQQINNMLGDAPTGRAFEPWRQNFAKFMGSLGVPVKAEDIANKDAAESLVNQFALSARSPEGPLGGLPGSSSNQDVTFLKAIPPNMEKTPLGRQLLVDAAKAKAEHLDRRAAAVREYRRGKPGGEMDPIELDSFKAAYDREHPMFTDVAKKYEGKLVVSSSPEQSGSGLNQSIRALVDKWKSKP